MKAKLTDMTMVECPHCGGNNEVGFDDFGDETTCQFTYCEINFDIPEFIDFAEMVSKEAETYV